MTEEKNFLNNMSVDLDQNAGVWVVVLVLFIFSVTFSGCAGKSRTAQLLTTDYVTMSDDDLLLYYYQLEDQIVADERTASGSSIGVGLGTGLFSHRSHFGGGLGFSTGIGSQATATELRDRRNAVRLELKRRGVTP